jgi:hypothetical protein
VKAVSRVRLRLLSLVLVVASVLAVAQPLSAQLDLSGIGPSKGQVIGAAVGAVAVITIVGVVIYFAVRQPRITGCAAAGPDGSMTLQGSKTGDPLYVLQNAPPTLQAGQRVKVFGKKMKQADKAKVFTVARVDKVYGACSPPAAPAHAMLDVPTGELAIAVP